MIRDVSNLGEWPEVLAVFNIEYVWDFMVQTLLDLDIKNNPPLFRRQLEAQLVEVGRRWLQSTI
jgi:hypothetical protein